MERNKGGGGPGRTGAVLQEVIKANERIAKEKHKVLPWPTCLTWVHMAHRGLEREKDIP